MSNTVNHVNKFVEHLLPALQWLDHRLVRAISAARQAYGVQATNDPFRGLHLGPEDVERMLTQQPGIPLLWKDEEDLSGFATVTANPTLSWLGRLLALDAFDLAIILLALAPEIDLRYQQLYSYLQDDVSRRKPTVDLALNLLCSSAEEKLARRIHFVPTAPLIHYDILSLSSSENDSSSIPLLSQSIKLDNTIADVILGGKGLDWRLGGLSELVEPKISLEELPLPIVQKTALRKLVEAIIAGNQSLRLYIRGALGAGQHLAAHALAQELGTTLMIIDLSLALAADPELLWLPGRIFRQQRLLGCIIYIAGYDQLRGEERRPARLLLQKAMSQSPGVIVLSGASAWQAEEVDVDDWFYLDFATLSFSEGRAWWQHELAGADLAVDPDGLDRLAERFRLFPEQITQAVKSARQSAYWQMAEAGEEAPKMELSLDQLFAAARAQSEMRIDGLAQKIHPHYTWNDIVLPEDSLAQLYEICQQVTQHHRVMDQWGFNLKLSMGKGIVALFAGPSGTGKTMAAEIIANELRLDLFRIDLSGVVSKYIGETEKNLESIFNAAAHTNAILFFDEADALFGKRSEVRDAHDRYANIEISYLLQKMEQYEGLAILATNLHRNLDEAFARRMAVIVQFPFPEEAHRLRIWRGIWPANTPLGNDVDLAFLAEKFNLSGGNIKNIALSAAYLAAGNGGVVSMQHLIFSTRREFQKMGKAIIASEFGPYSSILS